LPLPRDGIQPQATKSFPWRRNQASAEGLTAKILSIFAAQLPIDLADLFHPSVPLGMLQIEDIVERPMEVIGDVRYLLVQSFRGVAG